jgi:CRP-like cAMP-binding protein
LIVLAPALKKLMFVMFGNSGFNLKGTTLHPPLARYESKAGPAVRPPNGLVALLLQADFDLVSPYLRNLELVREQVIVAAGDEIKQAYLPHSGIISLVVRLAHGETTEVAMVGNQSIFGASAALGNSSALTTAIVTIGGTCSVLPITRLREAMHQSATLRTTLIQQEQSILVQAQQTAACNASHLTVARLARWLLRARDATGSDELQFTQESLGQMLGVHRNAVSFVACALKDKGVIQFSRAQIRIIDAIGLKSVACECYEAVRLELEQLRRGQVN